MNMPLNAVASPLREQAANTLRRTRKLPRGPYRNDLSQLGVGLLQLYKIDLRANIAIDKAAESSSKGHLNGMR
jgi:hypothetical protein